MKKILILLNGTSIRKKESLSLYLLASPRTPIQRQQNKETLGLAKKIRFEREQEFLDNREGYRLKKEKGINFLDYYQSYISNYSKKDIRMIQIALNRFHDFLAEYHPLLKDFIRPDAITHEKGTLPVVGSPFPSMMGSSIWLAGQKKERQRNLSFSTFHHTKAAVSPSSDG